LALHFRPVGKGALHGDRPEILDRGRGPDAGGGEGLARGAAEVGAEPVAAAIEVERDGLDLGEVAHEVRPGHVHASLVEATLKVDLQLQGEEAPDDVPDARVVVMVLDGADLERGLRGAEAALHAPEALVGRGDLGRREFRVGSIESRVDKGPCPDCR
jgi:hypothetical protein